MKVVKASTVALFSLQRMAPSPQQATSWLTAVAWAKKANALGFVRLGVEESGNERAPLQRGHRCRTVGDILCFKA